MNYSKRITRLKASAIRDVQKKIVKKADVISFAAGLPDQQLFPVADLKESTEKVIDEQGCVAFQYGLTKGFSPLIGEIAKRMREKKNVDISDENIVITTGSQQGLALAGLMLLDEGDLVLTENPSYLGAINAWRPYGCDFLGIETDQEGMVLEELRQVLSTHKNTKLIYVIPNFQNPTGKEWSLERRIKFMELVASFDVTVVEDDPYGELRFKGEELPTLASLDKKGQVIYLGSFSKVLCPGFRVAWMCANNDIASQAERLKEGLDLQCNQFSQLQVYQYLKDHGMEKQITTIVRSYKEKCEEMVRCISENFPKSCTYTDPDGGMFLWVELPAHLNANTLLDTAIERGVAYIPGEFFYVGAEKQNTLRLNFTTVSKEQIIKGIKILGGLLEEVC